MSFSGEVKEELSCQMSSSRHCQIAELSAIVMLCGQIVKKPSSNIFLKIQTENLSVARKYFTLLKKTFNIEADVLIKGNVLS
jgi:DNA-binding protein WhiA